MIVDFDSERPEAMDQELREFRIRIRAAPQRLGALAGDGFVAEFGVAFPSPDGPGQEQHASSTA